jgi:hypothetical protein
MPAQNESIGDEWVIRNFGSVDLGDRRRNERAVEMARNMLNQPDGSLPQQMKSSAALQAAYGLLNQDEVTYEALLYTHRQLSLELARQERVVLFVQDTTHVDHSRHRKTTGLGPIGDGRGQGYLIHSVLAVVPQPRRVLGLVAQEPFIRIPSPVGETRTERARRERESDVWARAVQAVGGPPPGARWVHIGDRGSDIFLFLDQCRQAQVEFLIRAARDRRVERPDGEIDHLFNVARLLPSRGETTLKVPASDTQPARSAQLQISLGPVTVQPANLVVGKEPLPVWIVRVWEAEPPAAVQEPLEWILLTSVPTLTVAEAWERIEWYKARWVIEDYHQCLKTGCAIEERQLREFEDLERLLGFQAPIAVFLLQLRDLARLTPDASAFTELPGDLVALVAHLADIPVEQLTLGQFWRAVARQGGYLGRRRDGPPGWKSLWRGWLYIHTLLKGIRLAAHIRPQRSD